MLWRKAQEQFIIKYMGKVNASGDAISPNTYRERRGAGGDVFIRK
jgi:hypothetical protein